MLTRKIGKLVRGKATPFQIMAACVLGAMIGFVPGLAQGPLLLVTLVLLLAVLNANLGLAALVGFGAKLASLALMPVSFEIGRVLIDGPSQGTFRWMINAPVLALFGFDYYATTGGVVLGAALGAVVGVLLTLALRGFRLRMARLEEGSERYQKLASKRWVRLLAWALIGPGHGKKTYAELAGKRMGNPVRMLGVVAVVLFVGLAFVGRLFLTEPIATAALKDQLERANGATVDLERADVDLSTGRLVVTGLAMADSERLTHDVFRADTVEANISGADLLRKRLVIDSVVASGAASGTARTTLGRRVGPDREASEPPAPKEEDEKTLDDYVADAEKWKDRLSQVRDWLERAGERDDSEGAPERAETLEERLRRQVREMGYARVRASHLVEEAPTLLVRSLRVDRLRVEAMEDELFGIECANLSTQPRLVEKEPRVRVITESGRFGADAVLVGGSGTIRAHASGLSGDEIGQALAAGGTAPIQGGTVDVAIDGTWGEGGVGFVDLPLEVLLQDTTLTLEGVGSTHVERMALPIGLRGPIDAPRVRVDQDALARALVDAGAAELASRVRGEASEALGQAREEAERKIQAEVGDKARDTLRNLVPRRDGGGG